MASSSPAASAASAKICFNSYCKDPKSKPPRRKGWRLRSGDHADLCERCFHVYEQGNFCEAFHSDTAGWRKCELCEKRLHCGCIVSLPGYLLLDAGGVECMGCARKTSAVAQNQMWAPSLLLPQQPQVHERPKEHPAKSWNQGTSSFPGQWRQASHMWSAIGPQSELQQRLAFEFDRPPNAEKLISVSRPSISSQVRRMTNLPEKQASSSLSHIVRDRYENETTGDNQMSTRKGVISDPCTSSSPGVNFETHPNSNGKPSILKGDPSFLIGLASPLSSPNGATDLGRISTTQAPRQMAPPLTKQISPNPHNQSDSCGEIRNGKSRADARTRAQLLPRYWPRITDQELQQISGNSNSVITPLFEKMLSASDAGRIGRLVLPKKCAEAYFPAISHPEGLPLTVQDAGGKEWIFQFRFWPNNNSRMYVLEGVTPCIQSMQLQAGDTVTFSRIDPEGKLVMGFRKASGISTEQDIETIKTGNGFSTPPEVNKHTADVTANGSPGPQKGSTESKNPFNAADQSNLSKFQKTGFIQKDGSNAKSSPDPSKRKSGAFGSKSKRLRIENEDSIELKITWEEAQELLRPHPNDVPSIVVIEGHEFEEYEEPPVLGKPTILTTNQAGDNNQWAQCDECLKWRKLPVDALLPSRWTCSENRWDPERSSCSSTQEISTELTDMLPAKTASRKLKVKVERNDNIDVSDGLDTLANLAILGEGEALPASDPPTTKHPRHRPGCTCIVCIQPPSGKGPKHKPTCTCNVCLTVRRRFRTLMLRREKRQSEKEAETAAAVKKQPDDLSPEMMHPQGSDPPPLAGNGISGSSAPHKTPANDGAIEDEPEKRKTLPSPLKAQIDLNIQPEREEEPSPVADAGGSTRPFRDAMPIA
ncbi:B3 domain-containing protein-like [Iris pallida]|uniref:B3 domain-containing protein-like n=1 Tax=Iris pallida TaxID=29817 RepID=A0AAX6I2M4_IRIPA|nr:B3 domain-containing protein-like [Iris pallida]